MHARMSVNPALLDTATASNQISKFSVSNYRADYCRVWPSQLFSENVHAFEGITPARMAVNIETGFAENKLKIKGLWETETETVSQPEPSSNVSSEQTSNGLNRDFESLVMRKLRQEEERKRLIKQMMEEDG